jgi:hypothetical protein
MIHFIIKKIESWFINLHNWTKILNNITQKLNGDNNLRVEGVIV